MIGLSGGLIGLTRTYARTGDNSGVWGLDELLPTKRFVVASGGTVPAGETYVAGGVDYRYHTFNASGTFTVTKPGFVEYLIHGAGSGGTANMPSNFGNGGAAGVARTGIIIVTEQDYTITVGAGSSGAGQATSSAGGSSSAFGITATGGNGCVHTSRTGATNADIGSFGTATGFNGAGGAGAGSTALPATSQNFGGAGFASAITGTLVIRGGGGGGGGVNLTNGGFGGGGSAAAAGPKDATANTGSGGAGGETTGGNGSAGVVIIRYIWK